MALCICWDAGFRPQWLRAETSSQLTDNSVQVRVGDGAFDPKHQKVLAYNADGVRLKLIPNPKQLSLEITPITRPNYTVMLPVEMVQVNLIRTVQARRVAVIGMINGSVFEVVVIDLPLAKITDRVFCMAASISPDGHFLAFVKFFPPHFVDGVEAHYMLYDFTKSAQQNRPLKAKLSDPATVGVTIYPPNIRNSEGDNTNLNPSNIHMLASEELSWNPDSRSLLFADSYHDEYSLVFAQVDSTKNGVQLSRFTLDKGLICGAIESPAHCYLHVAQINFGKHSAEFEARVTRMNGGTGFTKTVVVNRNEFLAVGDVPFSAVNLLWRLQTRGRNAGTSMITHTGRAASRWRGDA